MPHNRQSLCHEAKWAKIKWHGDLGSHTKHKIASWANAFGATIPDDPFQRRTRIGRAIGATRKLKPKFGNGLSSFANLNIFWYSKQSSVVCFCCWYSCILQCWALLFSKQEKMWAGIFKDRSISRLLTTFGSSSSYYTRTSIPRQR